MTDKTVAEMDKAYHDGRDMDAAYKENAKRDLAAYIPHHNPPIWDGNSEFMRDDYVMTEREIDAREAQEIREMEER